VITVGILGKNSAWILPYSLYTLRRQTVQPDEVIYVDGGSNDGSLKIVKEKMPSVKVVELPGSTIPEARNAVVERANGDIIVFWDSDILAPPNALELVVKGLQTYPIVAAERRDVYVNDSEEVERLVKEVESPAVLKGFREVDFVVFSVTAFRRGVFRRVGKFDPDLQQAEDREFGIRAKKLGFKSAYIEGLVAYDVNKRVISDVPVSAPLRIYFRGFRKKLKIYAMTPSRRLLINTASYTIAHVLTMYGVIADVPLYLLELVPLVYFVKKYRPRLAFAMWIKSVAFYTSILPYLLLVRLKRP